MNVISPETRMMGLPYGEEIMIVGRTMWTQSSSVTDRQTDRQTDRITITKTVQRIASHGKNRLVGLIILFCVLTAMFCNYKMLLLNRLGATIAFNTILI